MAGWILGFELMVLVGRLVLVFWICCLVLIGGFGFDGFWVGCFCVCFAFEFGLVLCLGLV